MSKKKICIICNGINTINFRGELIKELLYDYDVHVLFPFEDAPKDLEKLTDMGAICHNIPLVQHGLSLLEEYQLYRQICSHLNTIKPEVILNYTIKAIIWGSIAAKRNQLKSRVYSLVPGRGRILMMKPKLKHQVFRLIFHYLYRYALSKNLKVIFLNEDDLNYFINYKLLHVRQAIKVKSEGVCLKAFKKVPLTDTSKLVFFMAARIMRDKGVFEYLEAAKLLVAKHNGLEFQLAGNFDTSMTEEDKVRFEKLVEVDGINYLGNVKNMQDYLSNCHVYVLPSYQEGSSRSILEAMAVGRAIITTNATGCRDLLDKNGFLVEVGSSQDLSQKMEFLINAKDRSGFLKKLGDRSFELAQKDHDVKNINKIIKGILGV